MRITRLCAALAAVLHFSCNTQSAPSPLPPNDDVNSNINLNANDNQTAERFSLVAVTIGAGSVEPSAGTFAAGEVVTLTAIPEEGWRFDRWEGDVSADVIAGEPVIAVTVVEDTSVTAFFVKLPAPPPDNDNQSDPGNSNDNSSDPDDPGDDFDTASLIELDAGGLATLDETLQLSTDVHVYDLGPLALGDLFTADCVIDPSGALDPMIALFDADGFRVFWNDDVDLANGEFSSRVSGLIRHDSPRYFLAVTSTDFAETTGDYRLTIEVLRGVGAPSIAGHTIVLDFDGAEDVNIAGTDFGSPAPFDAGAIDSAFAGQTESLKQSILSLVSADFAAFDLTVLSTDDPPPAGPFTTVFMGEDNDELLGIANDLDFYNAVHDDNVIVFAVAFRGLTSDLTAMGQAIANVVSHEVGHSVGLMHTLDGTELMDNGGSDFPLLDDQSFGTATVFDFPIGLQNAPLLLNESLGPANARMISAPSGPLRCGTCGLPVNKIALKRGQQP